MLQWECHNLSSILACHGIASDTLITNRPRCLACARRLAGLFFRVCCTLGRNVWVTRRHPGLEVSSFLNLICCPIVIMYTPWVTICWIIGLRRCSGTYMPLLHCLRSGCAHSSSHIRAGQRFIFNTMTSSSHIHVPSEESMMGKSCMIATASTATRFEPKREVTCQQGSD